MKLMNTSPVPIEINHLKIYKRIYRVIRISIRKLIASMRNGSERADRIERHLSGVKQDQYIRALKTGVHVRF